MLVAYSLILRADIHGEYGSISTMYCLPLKGMAMERKNLPENRKIKSGQDASGDFAIVLPCEPDQFGEFIGKLLGKPQVIEKRIAGNFIIERNNVINLYHLINQRVEQQNHGVLVGFGITIYYDDNSNVRLASISEFENYAEVKNRISIGFNLSWTYLIKFSESLSPEKQDIDLTFTTLRSRFRPDEIAFVKVDDVDSYFDGWQGFKLRVQHTARSWGVDIESLVEGHVSTLRRLPVIGLKGFMRKYRSYTVTTLTSLFVAFMISSLILAIRYYSSVKTAEYEKEMSSVPSSADKISYGVQIIINRILSGEIQIYTAIVVGYSILIIASSIIFMEKLSSVINKRRSESVLLLTEQAIENYGHMKKDESRFWVDIVSVIGLGIISGIVANYIFAVLPKLIIG